MYREKISGKEMEEKIILEGKEAVEIKCRHLYGFALWKCQHTFWAKMVRPGIPGRVVVNTDLLYF
jgi:hypothetical protein